MDRKHQKEQKQEYKYHSLMRILVLDINVIMRSNMLDSFICIDL
nr:MAG TPA: hypothetical protein [Crassvirales sp.]